MYDSAQFSSTTNYILQNDQTVEWLYFTVLVTVPMGL